MNVPRFTSAFSGLLSNPRADVRASTAWLLGLSNEKEIIPQLLPCLSDEDPLVREFAMYSCAQLLRQFPDSETAQAIRKLETDSDVNVKHGYEQILPVVQAAGTGPSERLSADVVCGQERVLKGLMSSLLKPGFRDRMNINVF
jgi:hypothetical protein